MSVYGHRGVFQELDKGELVDDFLTDYMVTDVFVKKLSPTKHLFCDGYPRTTTQSLTFENEMRFFKRENTHVIYIEVGEIEAVKRMKLRARNDDTDAGIAKRIDEYRSKVLPAMEYFKNKVGYTIHTVNGEQSVEDVHKEIVIKLGL
jgi:adenylate kinase